MSREELTAETLINEFSAIGLQVRCEGVQCALLCVEKVLELGTFWLEADIQKDYPTTYSIEDTREFWERVRDIIKADREIY